MIRAAFKKDDNDRITAFRCKGHAGSGEYGKDIVCAAVSMLVINTINSVQKFTADRFDYSENEKDGCIYFSFKETPSEGSVLLMKSLELGLRETSKTYGKKYITLVEWEV